MVDPRLTTTVDLMDRMIQTLSVTALRHSYNAQVDSYPTNIVTDLWNAITKIGFFDKVKWSPLYRTKLASGNLLHSQQQRLRSLYAYNHSGTREWS